MDKFKNVLKTRLIAMRIYSAAVAVLLIIDVFGNIADKESNAVSFTIGVCTGMLLLVLFFMRKFALAMRNEESLKRLYIEENDERHKFIIAKTGGAAMNIVICGLALAAIVAGFFNEIVFLTLLGGLLFTALVKGTLKIYYNRTV